MIALGQAAERPSILMPVPLTAGLFEMPQDAVVAAQEAGQIEVWTRSICVLTDILDFDPAELGLFSSFPPFLRWPFQHRLFLHVAPTWRLWKGVLRCCGVHLICDKGGWLLLGGCSNREIAVLREDGCEAIQIDVLPEKGWQAQPASTYPFSRILSPAPFVWALARPPISAGWCMGAACLHIAVLPMGGLSVSDLSYYCYDY